MSTHTVNPRTIWALLAMEAGLALPIISLPTQGDRVSGPLGPLLLVLLLPFGYAAVCWFAALRDPSWRMLVGIGAGLATRALVSNVPEPGLSGLTLWFAHGVVPVAIGVGLWWRGAGLSVAELTASDVRAEFAVLSVCLVAALGLVRPFLLADPVLLGISVGVFALGGLAATALSRQDAAEVGSLPFGRLLAIGTAILAAAAGLVLVALLKPAVVGEMWLLLARLIELALTPIGLLIAWLASLFPSGPPPGPPPPIARAPNLGSDPAALAQLEERVGWIGYVVVGTLLVCAGLAAVLVVRVMLDNWIGAPIRRAERGEPADLSVERTGTPGGDAQDLLGWLLRWLRGRLAGRRGAVRVADVDEPLATDAWAAYRRLLEWASRQGLGRRPPETTRQLEGRLALHAPQLADAIDLLTETYESERYGERPPADEALRRVRAALSSLPDQG